MAPERASPTHGELPDAVAPASAHLTQDPDLFHLDDPYEQSFSPPHGHRPQATESQPPHASPSLSSSPPSAPSSYGTRYPLANSTSPLYSEVHSPDPERVWNIESPIEEKEVCCEGGPVAAAPAVQPLAAASAGQPRVTTEDRQPQQKKPWYKRWAIILLSLALVAIIAVAVTLGVVLGLRKTHSNAAAASPNSASATDHPSIPTTTAIPEMSVGGAISPEFYSKSGAWNGSGIAIAAANPGVDQTIYAFYQDYTGALQYTLMSTDGSWRLIGPVNAGSYKALNATPLSSVNHKLNDTLVWHVFYIDDTYTLRERVLTSNMNGTYTPYWKDGPLSDKNIKTNIANKIGMQACYWGDYYGIRSISNTTTPSSGIHLWYATSSTAFQQYSWTNRSQDWTFDQEWNDLDGHAGVGCQTWDTGTTEYVFFVNGRQEIAMYWKDSNETVRSTQAHPTNSWTPVDIGIKFVHKASGLGYTDYMIYQGDDATIKGANVNWAAENTTIAEGTETDLDTWTIQDVQTGNDIKAIDLTHLAITALATGSGGRSLTVFFQRQGNDISMYTRDKKNSGGLWQVARSPV